MENEITHQHWSAEITELRATLAPRKRLTKAQRVAIEAARANREQRLEYQRQVELSRWGGRPWRDAPA